MSFKSSVFNSADLDSEEISFAVGKLPPVGHCGYFLVRGYLIPYAHLHNLAALLKNGLTVYGKPIDPQRLFLDVWNEFSDIEREVMGECLIILLENKKMPIYFPEEVVDEHFGESFGKGVFAASYARAINCEHATK